MLSVPPSATWMAQVVGNQNDLEFLAKHFAAGSVRILPDPQENSYLLVSENFYASDSAKTIMEKASDLLQLLSGVMSMGRAPFAKLSSHAVFQVHSDGRRDANLFPRDVIAVRTELVPGTAFIDNSENQPLRIPVDQNPVDRLNLARRDAAVGKALRLLGQGANGWVELYRIYEVLERDMGGQHAMQELGWVRRDEIRRFKHSANSPAVGGDGARHGVELTHAPANPILLHEGKSIVDRLLTAWLNYKLSPQT